MYAFCTEVSAAKLSPSLAAFDFETFQAEYQRGLRCRNIVSRSFPEGQFTKPAKNQIELNTEDIP